MMESVQVAVRIRPLVQSELDIGCRSCMERTPKEPQISIGKNHFTYNHVFDESEGQKKVYNDAVHPLIHRLFQGYNVTILAYGQTGSGKTFTMGTDYSGTGELGVIPRAIFDIFDYIQAHQEFDYTVTASFVELYNESLYDLLTKQTREQSVVELREQQDGICIPGLTEISVRTPEETLNTLKEGSYGRMVGSTNMNAQSSRSHALFTINIRIQPKNNPKEVIRAKFHLVDLAGSERSKKTGATGDRFKEGVNINKGLLVLGNVISQLCEGNYFINYRDSKLTRLLQDSLGGNSMTLMIACVSPADYNYDESLSTLRYADRAKKIKNKPVVNQDPVTAELAKLRKENEELRLRLGTSRTSLARNEAEANAKVTDDKMNELSRALAEALAHNAVMREQALIAEKFGEDQLSRLNDLSETFSVTNHNVADIEAKILELKNCQKQFNLAIHRHDVYEMGFNPDTDGASDFHTPSCHKSILEQAKLDKQIDGLTKDLFWKEQLVARLCADYSAINKTVGEASEESLEEMKKQMAQLEAEKEELIQQMKQSSQTVATNQAKISEQRRKRMQELEQKVLNLSKKVTEQERIIKMREGSDEKIKRLREEIREGKQRKVQLVQQLKSESEKFRTLKQEKDREMCILRSQNSRKQILLKKMEQMYTMQQNVLKRKLEAAAAANKRIMAVLERQKAAKLRRTKGTPADRIKDKIAEELEMVESELHAKRSLDSLMLSRANLTRELADLKKNLEDPSLSTEEKSKLEANFKNTEEELALRNAEISDLQQKLLEIHSDDTQRENWDVLQSMAEAKFAMSQLLTLASEKLKEVWAKYHAVVELEEKIDEVERANSELKSNLEKCNETHKSELQKMERHYQERIHTLLHCLNTSDTSSREKSLVIQGEELDKIPRLLSKIDELQSRLDKAGESSAILEGKRRNLSRCNNASYGVLADEESLKAFDVSLPTDDDIENDPDWRKTPIQRRHRVLKRVKSNNGAADTTFIKHSPTEVDAAEEASSPTKRPRFFPDLRISANHKRVFPNGDEL